MNRQRSYSGGDRSLEEERYVDSTYRPSNPPMIVAAN